MGSDKSTGKAEKIHGVDLVDDRLLSASVPPGMHRRSATKMYDFAVDVTSLPGMYQSSDIGDAGDVGRLSGVLTAAFGTNNHRRDTLWQQKSRHALGNIKTKEDFMQHVEKVTSVRKSAFQRQADLFRHQLTKEGFKPSEIDKYVHTGGLPILILRTYGYYMELLHLLQGYAISATSTWVNSQAHHLLKYHSDKLLELRGAAFERRHFILRVYIYLRDAQSAKFTDISMMTKFFKVVDGLPSSAPVGRDTNSAPSPAPTSCGHCRFPALHVHIKRAQTKACCPFKDHSSTLARKHAAGLLSMKLQRPNVPVKDLVDQVLDDDPLYA